MTSAAETSPGAQLVGEHRLQLDMLKAIGNALTDGGNLDQIDVLLERLSEYTEVHFSSEQMLMRLYAYPGYQAHMDEHDRTLTWLDALRAAWRGGDRALTLETLTELHHWIEGHIRRADHAFESYLDSTRR
ncbi:MAG: hemerythrin family protein [Rhodospirillales bacterium]|jgi:hemerythrin-like metal-binding protein|nr:hemerythrin family protein [Rhodospirillales bacterium]